MTTTAPFPAVTMRHMGTKPKKTGKGRYKPYKSVRIPLRLAELLEELAEQDFDTFSDQVRAAVRERLIRRGKLPRPTTESG